MSHFRVGQAAIVPSRQYNVATYAAGTACLLAPLIVVAIYTLNLFYRTGAPFWDAGLYAHFATFSDGWPMLWPDVLHRLPEAPRTTFFSIHFMPIFYVTSALHQLVPWLTPAAWLSVLQGAWTGLIGLAVFILCAPSNRLAFAVAVAITTAFCGPMLAAIGFPHPELAIPAFFLVFVALRSIGYRTSAYVALALCFSVREDAGLHVAGPLFLLAAAQWMAGDGRCRSNAIAALTGVAYSLAALALQHFGFPDEMSHLERMYLGKPLFAHLTWSLLYERGAEFAIGRAYALWPAALLALAALWRRDLMLLAGALAAVPWVLLHLIAVKHQGLVAYYSFPLIITIAWPAVVHGAAAIRLQFGVALLSVVLFVVCGGANHDRHPWRSLNAPEFGAIGSYERVLREAVGHRSEFGRLMLDSPAVSLIPEAANLDEWAWQWAMDQLPNPDVLIYLPGAYDWEDTERILVAAGLSHRCKLADTPFVVASRSGTSLCR
jgi:hypothetical protein